MLFRKWRPISIAVIQPEINRFPVVLRNIDTDQLELSDPPGFFLSQKRSADIRVTSRVDVKCIPQGQRVDIKNENSATITGLERWKIR